MEHPPWHFVPSPFTRGKPLCIESCGLQVAFSHLGGPPLSEVLAALGKLVADEAGTDVVGGTH